MAFSFSLYIPNFVIAALIYTFLLGDIECLKRAKCPLDILPYHSDNVFLRKSRGSILRHVDSFEVARHRYLDRSIAQRLRKIAASPYNSHVHKRAMPIARYLPLKRARRISIVTERRSLSRHGRRDISLALEICDPRSRVPSETQIPPPNIGRRSPKRPHRHEAAETA